MGTPRAAGNRIPLRGWPTSLLASARTALDRLSNILKNFNEHFGTLFADGDRVARRITDDIAPKVAADQGYPKRQEEHSEYRPDGT
jgi:hypothetical protein